MISRLMTAVLGSALLVVSPAGGFAAAAPASLGQPATGTWISPHGNVKVSTAGCGDRLCGWVVWATPEAMQDARDGGVEQLIGTELLRDYRRTGENSWQGRVFVPDMGRTFFSRITRVDPDALQISGCILDGLLCKSQVWHRA